MAIYELVDKDMDEVVRRLTSRSEAVRLSKLMNLKLIVISEKRKPSKFKQGYETLGESLF